MLLIGRHKPNQPCPLSVVRGAFMFLVGILIARGRGIRAYEPRGLWGKVVGGGELARCSTGIRKYKVSPRDSVHSNPWRERYLCRLGGVFRVRLGSLMAPSLQLGTLWASSCVGGSWRKTPVRWCLCRQKNLYSAFPDSAWGSLPELTQWHVSYRTSGICISRYIAEKMPLTRVSDSICPGSHVLSERCSPLWKLKK